jgi:MFS family permease
MNAFVAIVVASLLARTSYQMAPSPALPTFAANLGAAPEFIGVIVAASTITGIFFKLPSGALSDVLGRRRMMVIGGLFFAAPPFLDPLVQEPWSLLAFRFVHGFATAIFSPVASAYVASLTILARQPGPLIGGSGSLFDRRYSLTYLLVGALGVVGLLLELRLPDVDSLPVTARHSAREWWNSDKGSSRC